MGSYPPAQATSRYLQDTPHPLFLFLFLALLITLASSCDKKGIESSSRPRGFLLSNQAFFKFDFTIKLTPTSKLHHYVNYDG